MSTEDIVKCEEKFAKVSTVASNKTHIPSLVSANNNPGTLLVQARAVNSILRHVADKLGYSKEQLDDLYMKTAWHFDDKLKKVTAGHDVFKAAVT